jgi:hypothetical protein
MTGVICSICKRLTGPKGQRRRHKEEAAQRRIQGAGGDDGAFGDDLPAFFRSLLALPIVSPDC